MHRRESVSVVYRFRWCTRVNGPSRFPAFGGVDVPPARASGTAWARSTRVAVWKYNSAELHGLDRVPVNDLRRWQGTRDDSEHGKGKR